MSRKQVVALLVAAAIVTSSRVASGATVDLSLNVTPTNLSFPNNGGTWRVVAKTDAPLGIAAISAYFLGVNALGVVFESDINAAIDEVGVFGSVVNVVYGQPTDVGPILTGVGRPSMSDGPDPLGNPAWNGATRIFSGTYSGAVPSFTASGANSTDANVLVFTTPGNPAADADTTTVVRVAVPEPGTAVGALIAALGLAAMRRRS